MKLDKKKKAKWLKALRSGKFKQGEGCLAAQVIDDYGVPTDKMEYCCLGVACKIGIAKRHKKFGRVYASFSFLEEEIQKTLADMNDGSDGARKSFKQIANWIEKNL